MTVWHTALLCCSRKK
ncbi:hypothetical protein Zm00014a_019931 [Zea mays]|uniref:Uncharacterized protein n=1 Tax=Zea mays TaxID=4577 RepID=A0A3L6FEF2_MAIZE|nr:hypothetical protein Zm00014a_019931 [Zea mays]